LHYVCNRLADAARLCVFADMIEHHRRRKNHGDWIHDGRVQFRVLGRGSVRWFEDGHVVAYVARSRESESAHQPCEGVGKDVAEQIRGDNDVVFFGFLFSHISWASMFVDQSAMPG